LLTVKGYESYKPLILCKLCLFERKKSGSSTEDYRRLNGRNQEVQRKESGGWTEEIRKKIWTLVEFKDFAGWGTYKLLVYTSLYKFERKKSGR